MNRHATFLSLLGMIVTVSVIGVARAAPSDTDPVWTRLKQTYFAHQSIQDGAGVIGLKAPYRAEDAAVVPITIKDLLPADSKRRIKKEWLIIDHNPVPMSAKFTFGPLAGHADIATRVRVNAYTTMRAIAETSDGKFYMATQYVKASGGCSAPASKDPLAAAARLGEMKLKTNAQTVPLGKPRQVLLMIHHPNNTGLQMNQLTRMYTPAHYVNHIAVDYAGKPVLTVNSTFSFSENPSLRFKFVPQDAGKLTANVTDNEDMHFSKSMQVEPPVATQAARPQT